MNEVKNKILAGLETLGIASPSWETCRQWLWDKDWRINVLSDYPNNEVKFTLRKGFERLEISGHSDLEVMAKAITEIKRRESF